MLLNRGNYFRLKSIHFAPTRYVLTFLASLKLHTKEKTDAHKFNFAEVDYQ